MKLVADTSALVSIAVTTDERQSVLPLILDGYDVTVPQQVLDELCEMAQYQDDHGVAAQAILDRRTQFTVHDIETVTELPLDEGENAAIQLATELDAAFFYCDEFNQLALIHASLADSQLVTTPRLLKALVVHGSLANANARAILEGIYHKRSWEGNAYVCQAMDLFE